MLSKNISYMIIFLLLLIAAMATLYITRSGNSGLLLFGDKELFLRNLLENIFVVRPRSKELFFAYPLLFITLYYWKSLSISAKKVLLILSSLVIISVINSFAHVHTPYFITIYRSLVGMVGGSLLGCLIILGYRYLSRKEK